MKLWDIVKRVGSSVVRNAVPGGDLILGAVNELLPNEHKLPGNATGDQVSDAIERLPPEHQAEVLMREFDVKKEQITQPHETLRTMLECDAKNPQSTRPKIALGSFRVISFSIIVVVSTWAYGVLSSNVEVIDAVTEGWAFILAVLGPLVTVLHAYFGSLKKEHRNRMDAANGGPIRPGIIGSIVKLIKKA